ncbi:hypothetical protein FHU29_004568 [Hoyosella altamirensis]|uniref:Uncharacterized protein n=1 Tax=Hoyosella altamirensis TaxID=616997 RepID=A0A839RW58_9ACTN|nr:hypothetical protein [Hoyosella altamirensis]
MFEQVCGLNVDLERVVSIKKVQIEEFRHRINVLQVTTFEHLEGTATTQRRARAVQMR